MPEQVVWCLGDRPLGARQMVSRAPRPSSRVALEDLYRQHGHIVLRRARALLVEEEEARDVVQEVFTSLLARPGQFGGLSAITTWLYSVTTHACLTRMRSRRTRERLLRERPATMAPAATAADGESTTLLRQLLVRLPEELAVVAIHYYLDEMTQQEIAEQIGGSRRRVGDLIRQIQQLAGLLETDSSVQRTKEGKRA
jgi:RNA polymerase sigma factor (sigma-70 family)